MRNIHSRSEVTTSCMFIKPITTMHIIYVVYVANQLHLFILIRKINAINVSTFITLLLRAAAPCALISI